MRNELSEPARGCVERLDDLAVVAAREGRLGSPQVQPRHLSRAMTAEAVLSQDEVCLSRKFLRGFLWKPGARSRQEEKHYQVEDARQCDKIAIFADDHLIPPPISFSIFHITFVICHCLLPRDSGNDK